MVNDKPVIVDIQFDANNMTTSMADVDSALKGLKSVILTAFKTIVKGINAVVKVPWPSWPGC